MFNGDFREKNQTEVPVNVDGTNAEHFEAFLQCLYPCGREPNGKNSRLTKAADRTMLSVLSCSADYARGLLRREARHGEMRRHASAPARRFQSRQDAHCR